MPSHLMHVSVITSHVKHLYGRPVSLPTQWWVVFSAAARATVMRSARFGVICKKASVSASNFADSCWLFTMFVLAVAAGAGVECEFGLTG